MATFDPTKSSSTTEKLADFCRKEIKSGDDIKLVPGVGPSVQTVLRDNGIDTIAQLLAKFLAQIDGVRDTNEVCQAFYDYMKGLVKGTSAAAVNMHTPTFAMANYASEKGLFEYDM